MSFISSELQTLLASNGHTSLTATYSMHVTAVHILYALLVDFVNLFVSTP